jgi:YHS domain-containing protein
MTSLLQKFQLNDNQSLKLVNPPAGLANFLISENIDVAASSETDQILSPPAQTVERFHTVCKRVIWAAPAYFPQAEYRGKVIYFCTEPCRNAFLADPERFYCVHSQPRKGT